jgi:hypothetical protein
LILNEKDEYSILEKKAAKGLNKEIIPGRRCLTR